MDSISMGGILIFDERLDISREVGRLYPFHLQFIPVVYNLAQLLVNLPLVNRPPLFTKVLLRIRMTACVTRSIAV